MRIAKFLPILFALAAFSTPRATADGEYSSDSTTAVLAANVHEAYAVHIAGYAAITVVDQPGATIDVWAVAADGEVVQVAHGTMDVSGTATVFAPHLGAGFVVGSSIMGIDIRDWLE